MDDRKKLLLAVAIGIVAVGILLWQTLFRGDPNAVGVKDMPADTRLQPGTQRDPAAGPVPVDLSRRGAPAPARANP